MCNIVWCALFRSIILLPLYTLSYSQYMNESGRTVSFMNYNVCHPRTELGFVGPYKLEMSGIWNCKYKIARPHPGPWKLHYLQANLSLVPSPAFPSFSITDPERMENSFGWEWVTSQKNWVCFIINIIEFRKRRIRYSVTQGKNKMYGNYKDDKFF